MSTESKQLLIKVATDAQAAIGQLSGVDRSLKEILKTVTQVNAQMGGGTPGAGQPLLGGAGLGKVAGLTGTRLSKIILENQDAMRKLRSEHAKEFQASTRIIDRSLEQEGKRVEQHTARIKKLSEAYSQNREWIDSGAIKNPDFVKRTDRLGKRLITAIGQRQTALENIEEMKDLNKNDPKTILQKLGGWPSIMQGIGAIGGLAIMGSNFIQQSAMREQRIASAVQAPAYSFLQSAIGGNLNMGYAAANGDLGRAVAAARGTSHIIVRAGGQLLGSIGGGAAAGAMFGAVPGAVIGGMLGLVGGGIAAYNTVADRSSEEAANIQEALGNAVNGIPSAKRVGLEHYQAHAAQYLRAYRAFGRSATDAAYDIGNRLYGRSSGEVDAAKFSLRSMAGRGIANSLFGTVLESENAGMEGSAGILGNMSVGSRSADPLYRSLINGAMGTGDDPTIALQALGRASADLIGPDGVAGPAYLNALMGGAFNADGPAQKLIFARNQAGMAALSAMTTGSASAYQQSRNLDLAMKILPHDLYGQNWLATLDPRSLAALAKDGDATRFGNLADNGRGLAQKMLTGELDIYGTYITSGMNGVEGSAYRAIHSKKYGGSFSKWALDPLNADMAGKVLGDIRGIGDLAGRGLRDDFANFNEPSFNIKPFNDNGKGQPAGQAAQNAANFEKMLRSLATDGDITDGLERLAKYALPAAIGLQALADAVDPTKKRTPSADELAHPYRASVVPLPKKKARR